MLLLKKIYYFFQDIMSFLFGEEEEEKIYLGFATVNQIMLKEQVKAIIENAQKKGNDKK